MKQTEIEIPAALVVAIVAFLFFAGVEILGAYNQSKCIEARGSWDSAKGCTFK